MLINEGWVNGVDYGWGCFYCGISMDAPLLFRVPVYYKTFDNNEVYRVCSLHGGGGKQALTPELRPLPELTRDE